MERRWTEEAEKWTAIGGEMEDKWIIGGVEDRWRGGREVEEWTIKGEKDLDIQC